LPTLLNIILICFTLFFLGICGIFLNRANVIILLICIELMLLSVNLLFVLFSHYLDNLLGFIFSLYILTIAAAESAIGLAILLTFYRLRGHLYLNFTPKLLD
jgi:NADH-quinone oxidoreductase subunit K